MEQKHLESEKELRDAQKRGNPYAMQVEGIKEKEYTNILYNLQQTQDSLAAKIYDMITEYYGLIEEIQKIESKIYDISGEWGLNHFDSVHQFPNINKLAKEWDI